MAIRTREELSVRINGQQRQQWCAHVRLLAAHRDGKHETPAIKCGECRKVLAR